ncbi:hypothetical protein E2562_016107 [Oryza meyeriana var. granulata]|uniref:Uncharacterized protein n=1 Tax=Oryza meyeriana var. granulata TaxID=110450 RepID=A0A6G1BL16_9ORYZ|nr:hypothetical protein E2562_016107 [Oryza meyeriana var. granulata]
MEEDAENPRLSLGGDKLEERAGGGGDAENGIIGSGAAATVAAAIAPTAAAPAGDPILPPPARVPSRSTVREGHARARNQTPAAATTPPRVPSVLQGVQLGGMTRSSKPFVGRAPAGLPSCGMISGPGDAGEHGAGSGLGGVIVTLAYEFLG